MQQVLVLNASYEPLNVTTVRRAHVLVFKGKAEVIEKLEQPLRTATDTYPRPHVIRLVQYVRVPRTLQRKIARREADARPRRAAEPGRRLGLGERRHLVRPLQHAQGQPASGGGLDGAAREAAAARSGALHPPRDAQDPERLAAVPERLRVRYRVT